jgi:acyl carrier protein
VVSHTADEPFLVAYVTCVDAITDGDLKEFLLQWLPVYMVPAVYVFVDRMPLTPSGKIDRAALPQPHRESRREHVEPRDRTEERLAAIWMEVLALDDIGVHDNFFELGGHSLLALQLLSKMKRTLGVDLPIGRLFDLPTIAEIAVDVRAQGESAPA